MSEQRFVSVKALKDKFEEWSLIGELSIEEIGGVIDETPTIDPETLPIVQELREKLAQAKNDCDRLSKKYAQCAVKLNKANKTAENWENCLLKEFEKRKGLEQKLSRYEQAEQEGKFIFLPCKIGDIVWVLTYSDGIKSKGLEIIKCEVRTMRIKTNGKTINYSCLGHYKNNHYYNGNFVFNSIGKTVFLTREEAENVLKEREKE